MRFIREDKNSRASRVYSFGFGNPRLRKIEPETAYPRRRRMKLAVHFILLLIACFATALPSPFHAQSGQQTTLIEGAKKEGKLVWYTSMAIDTSKPLVDAFLQEYPFIEADLVRAGEEQLANRIMAETRAGKWYFDAVSTSSISILTEKHMITPYLPPERDA